MWSEWKPEAHRAKMGRARRSHQTQAWELSKEPDKQKQSKVVSGRRPVTRRRLVLAGAESETEAREATVLGRARP